MMHWLTSAAKISESCQPNEFAPASGELAAPYASAQAARRVGPAPDNRRRRRDSDERRGETPERLSPDRDAGRKITLRYTPRPPASRRANGGVFRPASSLAVDRAGATVGEAPRANADSGGAPDEGAHGDEHGKRGEDEDDR